MEGARHRAWPRLDWLALDGVGGAVVGAGAVVFVHGLVPLACVSAWYPTTRLVAERPHDVDGDGVGALPVLGGHAVDSLAVGGHVAGGEDGCDLGDGVGVALERDEWPSGWVNVGEVVEGDLMAGTME